LLTRCLRSCATRGRPIGWLRRFRPAKTGHDTERGLSAPGP
jgi:hypothetical protein